MLVLKKLVKLVADIVMLFLLIGGAANIYLMTLPNPVAPDGPGDLGSLTITVKSLTKVPPSYAITAEEASTKFILIGPPSAFNNIETQIKIGSKASVQIKRESIDDLRDISSVWAYSLTSQDGIKVFDSSKNIPQHQSLTRIDRANIMFDGMVAIPVLYFLLRGFYRISRRSALNQNI